MKTNELFKNVECITPPPMDISINKVTSRLNEIKSDTLFVWVKGISRNTDGMLEDILKMKPSVIVTEKEIEQKTDIPTVRVKNARSALSFLLFNFYELNQNTPRLVAVTGTNGKTTTATLIYEILQRCGENVGFIGTGKIEYNGKLYTDSHYSMTTPDPEILYPAIKNIYSSGAKTVVMEVSSHALALSKVAPLKFKLSIFTNLTKEHLDFHKSLRNYFRAKLTLFSISDQALFNIDTRYGKIAFKKSKKKCKAYTVSVSKKADYTASDIILNGFDGAEFLYRSKDKTASVISRLSGLYNVSNALMALSAVSLLNVDTDRAASLIKEIDHIDGRLELIRDSVNVIIDYAHTPDAFKKILKLTYSLKKQGQNIICVFGCGGERDSKKRAVMGSVAERFSDHIYVTEDNSRSERREKIISDILIGIKDVRKRSVITSRTLAIQKAIATAKPNDIVLVLGKGHERYFIDNEGYHDYNEREIIAEALSKRNERNYNEN